VRSAGNGLVAPFGTINRASTLSLCWSAAILPEDPRAQVQFQYLDVQYVQNFRFGNGK
jgi:hypothetical protein